MGSPHRVFTAQGPEHSGTIAQNFDEDAAPEVTPELVLHMGGHTVAHGVAFGGQGHVGPEMLLDDAVEAWCLQAADLASGALCNASMAAAPGWRVASHRR